MKLWRCYNAKCSETGIPGFDFEVPETEKPKCPKCGITREMPRFSHLLVERVQIHFDAPSGIVDGIGKGFIACDPSKLVGKYRATGAPSAVTCAACKATEAYKAAVTADSVHPDFEVTANVDAATGTITLNK
jgi:predicted nucleic-acid-binding Zn-ribbon protein